MLTAASAERGCQPHPGRARLASALLLPASRASMRRPHASAHLMYVSRSMEMELTTPVRTSRMAREAQKNMCHMVREMG